MPLKYFQIALLGSVFMLHYLYEHLSPQHKELNNWKNERFNILIGLLNILFNIIPATLLIYLLAFIDQLNIGLLQQLHLPFVLKLPLTIVILDLWMYWWHRLNHTIPFLWQWHLFHHRDEQMNSTTAVRFHIVELFLSTPGKGVIYLLFGMEYQAVIIYEVLFFTAVVFHHSNIYITEKVDRVYRLLFASPIMHRIHHSKKKEELHSNYGALFSFWDRLFSSIKLKANGKINFGIEE